MHSSGASHLQRIRVNDRQISIHDTRPAQKSSSETAAIMMRTVDSARTKTKRPPGNVGGLFFKGE